MSNTFDFRTTAEELAPIEQAHLLRGFDSKKTPVKWIKFFRLCVIQRNVALKKKNKSIKIIWGVFLSIALVAFLLNKYTAAVVIISLIIALILQSRIKRDFNTKFTDGYDFFSDYFSALFTLIEEELPALGTIRVKANVNNSIDDQYLLESKGITVDTPRFVSGLEQFYEREISNGNCTLKDGTEISFSFVEKIRERTVNKRSQSGKRKTKSKYKSVYPFLLKMTIPKALYDLKPEVAKEDIELNEDESFYYLKARRKFDIKEESPEKYSYFKENSIYDFTTEYFSLEIINLLNICYGCFNLKSNQTNG